MIHLTKITIRESKEDKYPFNIPLVKNIREMDFISPVTILVGENGTGKSTFLESLAVAVGSVTVGSESIMTDTTLSHARELSDYISLSWKVKTRKGFFLRAEDFFNFANKMAQMAQELKDDLKKLELEYKGRTAHALKLAQMPYVGSLQGIKQSYGEGLNVRSHGESFMDLFQSRLAPGGLYILDEPETPLSPTRQLAFISLIKEMVQKNCQFIIATHSPILMAYPNATIYNLDQFPLKKTNFQDLEHVKLTKDFLNNPELFLRHL
ncbi:AAA family ATPase [Alkalicella caledoniensis]|uniref:AAA family ATPase n=1 Tax=Alkalicella caledoniensis TaxID=2731377 RepID=A0A7G9WAQ7_ALKCA|nr:AAA family ATPase [Alkalicella caledoniensis]QNO15769.1 AAA family ATPase [Alkalicella caledoniensis]